MKKFVLCVSLACAVLCMATPTIAQVSSTANGGSGGSGGTAAGGMATGGTASNTSNIGSATSNYQGGAEVSVNYITPAGAAGVNGLAPGVDPNTNHLVNDTNFRTSGTTKIKNTPDVNLGGPASGACNGLSGGVGVGIPGLAVAGNISTVDKGCEARETARVAAMLGRMDVANAILENMDVVVAALKAKNERAARESEQVAAAQAQTQRANAANAALAQAVRAQEADALRAQQQAARDREADTLREQQQAAREREAESMRAQQQAGIEALARQATMAKVYDTLTFTGKLTQGEEKTPQQVMADDLVAKQQAAEKLNAEKLAAEARAAALVPVVVPARVEVAAPAPTAAEPRRETAQTQAKSDEHSARAPVLALAAAAAQSAPPASKTDAGKATAPQRREVVEKKRVAEDKADPQAAMRFALGLSD